MLKYRAHFRCWVVSVANLASRIYINFHHGVGARFIAPLTIVMIKTMIRLFVFIWMLFASVTVAAELEVSVPRSLKGAMIEICELHEKNHPQWKVKLRSGKSSELGRMIASGHSTDAFVLADDKLVQQLQKKNQIGNVRRFLADDLVVIASATSTLTITEPSKLVFPELKGVALMGEKHPVGKIARAYLTKEKVLSNIQTKISPKKSTKEVVAGIVAGEADWGIIYGSDAIHAKGVKVIWKIPETGARSEIYYIGTVNDSEHPAEARQFLQTLNSTIAKKIFENAGLRLIHNP